MLEIEFYDEFELLKKQNKEFSKRIDYDKFVEIINSLNIIENKVFTNKFKGYESVTYRNIEIIKSCPSIVIRSNSDNIKKVYDILKKHDELNIINDGFSCLYSNPLKIDKMLSYLKKQVYYPYLTKKQTLLTNGKLEDMVSISEFFKELFNENEQKIFFSKASVVLSLKFENIVNIYNTLFNYNFDNEDIITCSSIFTRKDPKNIEEVLNQLQKIQKKFNPNKVTNLLKSPIISILATSKPEQLVSIMNTIKVYVEENQTAFVENNPIEFVDDCQTILARGNNEVIKNSFATFKEYDSLELLKHGKKPLLEERKKLCDLLDILLENKLYGGLSDNISVLSNNFDNVISKICYFHEETGVDFESKEIQKLIIGKNHYWDSSFHKIKFDSMVLNNKKTFKLNNEKLYGIEELLLNKNNNYPNVKCEVTDSIIKKLDSEYLYDNLRYKISGEYISRPKTIRNLTYLLNCNNLDHNKIITTAILYNKIASEEKLFNVSAEINNTLNSKIKIKVK